MHNLKRKKKKKKVGVVMSEVCEGEGEGREGVLKPCFSPTCLESHPERHGASDGDDCVDICELTQCTQ